MRKRGHANSTGCIHPRAAIFWQKPKVKSVWILLKTPFLPPSPPPPPPPLVDETSPNSQAVQYSDIIYQWLGILIWQRSKFFAIMYILVYFLDFWAPQGGGGTLRLLRPVPIQRPSSILTLYTQVRYQDLKKKQVTCKTVHFATFWAPQFSQFSGLPVF